jgi:RNA polymerase sigma-70 factor (ECF subfamily)
MSDFAETCLDTWMHSERRPKQEYPSPAGGGFAGLLARYEADIRRVAAGMGFGPDDADDILQDVLAKALASPPAYRGEEEARRWLLRVATNRCILEFRRRKRFERKAADIVARRPAEEAASAGPAARAMRAEEVERIRACLAGLDEALLAPPVLKYFNGLTSRQIGEVLDLPPGTVRSRLHEVRLILARRLMEGERR